MLFKKIALFMGIAVAGMPLHVQAQFSPAENERLAIVFSLFTGGFFTAAVGCFYRILKANNKLVQNQNKQNLRNCFYIKFENLFEARKAEFLANESILNKVCKEEFFKKRSKYFMNVGDPMSKISPEKLIADTIGAKPNYSILKDACCAYELNYENGNLLNDLQSLYNSANSIYGSDFVNFDLSFHQEGINSSKKEEKFNEYVYNLVHRNSQQFADTVQVDFEKIKEHREKTRVKNEKNIFYNMVGGMTCLLLGVVTWKNVIDIYHVK